MFDLDDPLSFAIARELLDKLAYTAVVRDLKSHTDCVSHTLVVLGVPGAGTLNYEDWLARRRNELEKPLLKGLSYRDLTIISSGPQRISCSVREIMKSVKGPVMALHKEVVIAQESDGCWRVVTEHIKAARIEK